MAKNVVQSAVEKFNKDKTANSLKNRLDKTYPRSVYTGAAISGIKVPRIPSGSFVFDLITGGGIPQNRITIFHGPKSSSKTTFAMRIAGMFQHLHPQLSVLFLDFEQTFDSTWAERFIPDIDRLHVVQPSFGEEGIDIMKAYAEEAEDVGLVIVDSLGGLIPTAEAEAGAADYTQIGLQVRLINRLLKIMLINMGQATKRGQHLTLLAINQIRANMNRSGPYSPSFSQPGGKTLEHAASMDIRFYGGDYDKVQGVPVKAKHKFQVDKNKVGIPKRSGEFSYYITDVNGYHTGELDEDKIVLTYAKRAGVILRDGNKWTIPMKKDPLVFDNMVKMVAHLRENPKLMGSIKAATLRACVQNPLLSADEEGEK